MIEFDDDNQRGGYLFLDDVTAEDAAIRPPLQPSHGIVTFEISGTQNTQNAYARAVDEARLRKQIRRSPHVHLTAALRPK